MSFRVTAGDELLACFDEIESRREYTHVELVERRLQRLIASAAGFFRGAPSLFYALVRKHRGAQALLGRDTRWIVGDVHLENIGVIAVGDHQLVFDFNDLDEAVVASPMLDVLRGAASAAVSAVDLKLGPRAAIRAAEAFIIAYIRPLAEELPRAVVELLTRAKTRTTDELLNERAPLRDGQRRFLLGKRYWALDPDELRVATELFERYSAERLLPWATKRLRLEDAAFRVQGTGSLGVRRFIYLARAGKKGEQMLIEAKEMRKSAVVRGGAAPAPKAPPRHGEAQRVSRAMEALLTDPQVGVRALRGLDKRSYLMRLHAPGEDKLAITSLKSEDELLALSRMVGYRLSQAHERAAGRAPPAFDPGRTLSCALDLASAMQRAHQALVIRANLMSGI